MFHCSVSLIRSKVVGITTPAKLSYVEVRQMPGTLSLEGTELHHFVSRDLGLLPAVCVAAPWYPPSFLGFVDVWPREAVQTLTRELGLIGGPLVSVRGPIFVCSSDMYGNEERAEHCW